MEYKSDLKTTTKVWWRFFWRYAVIFVAVNLFAGLTVNLWGHILPKGLYTVMLLSGVLGEAARPGARLAQTCLAFRLPPQEGAV